MRFVLCTTRLAGRDDLPANVEAGPVPFARFVELMLSAAVVLVPLHKELHRITGTMTYLESMWLKKFTVVPDALAVREYIEDNVPGVGWMVQQTVTYKLFAGLWRLKMPRK